MPHMLHLHFASGRTYFINNNIPQMAPLTCSCNPLIALMHLFQIHSLDGATWKGGSGVDKQGALSRRCIIFLKHDSAQEEEDI